MGALRRVRSGLRHLRVLQAPGRVDAYVFAPELETTYRPRNPNRPTLVQISGGVIAAPGQNGHLELRVGDSDPPQHIAGAIATRHELGTPPEAQRLTARVGSGGQLTAIVPAGFVYRLSTHTVQGYETPEFVLTTALTETPL